MKNTALVNFFFIMFQYIFSLHIFLGILLNWFLSINKSKTKHNVNVFILFCYTCSGRYVMQFFMTKPIPQLKR